MALCFLDLPFTAKPVDRQSTRQPRSQTVSLSTQRTEFGEVWHLPGFALVAIPGDVQ